VIPFGLNTYVPDTPLSKSDARAFLGLGETEKVLRFFGQIASYKGLDVLLDALKILGSQQPSYRPIIAGRAKLGSETYWWALKLDLEGDPMPWKSPWRDTPGNESVGRSSRCVPVSRGAPPSTGTPRPRWCPAAQTSPSVALTVTRASQPAQVRLTDLPVKVVLLYGRTLFRETLPILIRQGNPAR
jgi:hypothetical protein